MTGPSGFMRTVTLKLDPSQDPPTVVGQKGTFEVGSQVSTVTTMEPRCMPGPWDRQEEKP